MRATAIDAQIATTTRATSIADAVGAPAASSGVGSAGGRAAFSEAMTRPGLAEPWLDQEATCGGTPEARSARTSRTRWNSRALSKKKSAPKERLRSRYCGNA